MKYECSASSDKTLEAALYWHDKRMLTGHAILCSLCSFALLPSLKILSTSINSSSCLHLAQKPHCYRHKA